MPYSGPTIVQTISEGYSALVPNTPTQSSAFGSPNTPGNSILVGIEFYGSDSISGTVIADLAGNTYHLVTSHGNSGGSKSCAAIYRTDKIPAYTSNKITITTPSGAGFGGAYIIETTPLGLTDQTGFATTSSGTFGPTVTPTQNNELCIVMTGDSGGFTWTVGTSVAWAQVGAGSIGGIMEHFEQATAAAIQGDTTATGFQNSVSVMATFPLPNTFGTPTVSSNAAGPTVGFTTTASLNTATGDLMIVGIAVNDITNGVIATITDTAGNTYVPLTRRVITAKGWAMQYFYCLSAIANAANIVSGTFAVAAAYNIAVWDVPISGVVLYDTDSAWGTGFNGDTAAFTTTGTDEFVAVFSFDAWGGWTYTAGSGYTLDSASIPPNNIGAAEHRLFSSPQVGITAAFGNHPSSGSAAIAVAFKGPTNFFVQACDGSENHASTTQTAVFGSNNTAGNLIVVDVSYWVAGGVTGGITVHDSIGNTYASCGTPITVDNGTSQVFYAKNIGAGPNTVTVTTGFVGDLNVIATEYSGCLASGPLDAYVAAASVGSVTTLSSGSLTTSFPGDLLHVLAHNVSLNTTFTLDTGYTLRETLTNTDGMGSGSGDNAVGAAGSYSSTTTMGSSGYMLTALVAFKPAGSSVFGTPVTNFKGARSSPTLVSDSLNVAAGSLIIVGLEWSDGGTASVTDNTSPTPNTYTGLTKWNTLYVNGLQYFYCLSSVANAGMVITATFTTGTNNFTSMAVWVVPLSASVVFDVEAGVGSDSGGVITTASFSTTGVDEFVAMFLSDGGYGSGTWAQGAGYTLDSAKYGAVNTGESAAQHTRFSSSQSSITASMSASIGSGGGGIAAAFKVFTPAPPPPSVSTVVCIMN